MIEILPGTIENFIAVKVSGKLTKDDFDKVISIAEDRIRGYGKTKWLIEVDDFNGMGVHVAFDDVKFDLKHYEEIIKVALVGSSELQKWVTRLSTVFVSGEVKYFDNSQKADAFNWASN